MAMTGTTTNRKAFNQSYKIRKLEENLKVNKKAFENHFYQKLPQKPEEFVKLPPSTRQKLEDLHRNEVVLGAPGDPALLYGGAATSHRKRKAQFTDLYKEKDGKYEFNCASHLPTSVIPIGNANANAAARVFV